MTIGDMNLIPHVLRPKLTAANESLDSLFAEARSFGRVILHTHTDGDYSVQISFHTTDHTKLEASSGYGNKSPHEAFRKAIARAQHIRSAFK